MPSSRRKWKGTERRKGDKVLDPAEVKPTDIIIPIMGPTGAGKSTFINTAVGKDAVFVGQDVKSCTESLQHVIVDYPKDPSRRVVFVDTPGFDDTYESDFEILRRIAVWLAQSYNDDKRLTGVIYLHEITQKRMMDTSRKNLEMFHKLCGHDASRNVVLATTKWANVTEGAGKRHEGQLKNTFWKNLINEGSEMTRFLNDSKSAWAIVDHIVASSDELRALHIQRELVDLQTVIPETEACNSLRETLQELLSSHQKTVADLTNDQQRRGTAEMQRRLQEVEDQIRSSMSQLKQLQIRRPLSTRLMTLAGLGAGSRADVQVEIGGPPAPQLGAGRSTPAPAIKAPVTLPTASPAPDLHEKPEGSNHGGMLPSAPVAGSSKRIGNTRVRKTSTRPAAMPAPSEESVNNSEQNVGCLVHV
ncbi:P-loop containing nucleoside triphosphate hydrolase protein [Leucogyrophana mollusca]|uniref:P-loop containing nucleoside triphosphate hydrolase protein n=1 Tax=Leucogyrophana mollusca TaxID=85980 RepID=A0ACB8B3T4_9AGAM|nr:P-loop containing nucleoside triphosphate hydrolase protein [Leucogyrophana mollusca]